MVHWIQRNAAIFPWGTVSRHVRRVRMRKFVNGDGDHQGKERSHYIKWVKVKAQIIILVPADQASCLGAKDHPAFRAEL